MLNASKEFTSSELQISHIWNSSSDSVDSWPESAALSNQKIENRRPWLYYFGTMTITQRKFLKKIPENMENLYKR